MRDRGKPEGIRVEELYKIWIEVHVVRRKSRCVWLPISKKIITRDQ